VSAQGYERRFRPENADPFASCPYFEENMAVEIAALGAMGVGHLQRELPRWVQDGSRRATTAVTYSDLDPLDFARSHL
jgi:hypothetical protein